MPHNVKRPILLLCGLVLACACGSDSNKSPADAALAPADGAGEAGIDMGVVPDGGVTRSLSGKVTDKAGTAVFGAQIVAGGVSAYSDGQGLYTLVSVPSGQLALGVSREYFKPTQFLVDVNAVGETRYDIVLEEMPLMLDPADVALAAAYNQTFDWTKQTLSIAIAPMATRRNFDNAVYWHNPALYRDTSSQPPLAPTPLPAIAAGVATGFTFPIHGGANDGKEALVLATLVDSLSATPVAALEKTDYMLWTPMLNWLTDWNATKSADLKLVGVAVRQQSWGTTTQRPQELGRVYLDATSAALWVEIVFAKFVQLGDGIADDDGDGFKEVFAKIDSSYVSQEILGALTQYRETRYTTYAMSKEVIKALREIYSTTSAQVAGTMGQPYAIAGLGTIAYPFVVLQHAAGQVNVILVGP